MRDRNEKGPDSGEQEMFFRRLQDNLGSRIRLAPVVASTLNISEKTAYRKIRGDVALFFHEAMQLERLILPGPDGAHHARYRLFANSHFSPLSLDDYWSVLDDSLGLWSKSSRPYGYMETTGIPNLLYFGFPELAAFRYHLMLGETRFRTEEIRNADSWLKKGHVAMNTWFNTGKTHLILDKTECIESIQLVMNALKRHQRRDPSGALLMKQQMREVIHSLRKIAENPEERCWVYLTQFGITRPVACLLNDGRGQTLWPMPGLGFLSTNDPTVADYYQKIFELKIRRSSMLCKSPFFSKLFFDALEDSFEDAL